MATINKWLWVFGDGYTSAEQHPNHQYTMPGKYNWSMTAYIGNVAQTPVTGTVRVSLYGEGTNAFNVSHTNTSYRMGIRNDQGIGFSKNSGTGWVYPEGRIGALTLRDKQGQDHQVVLDAIDGRMWEITNRDGPDNTGIEKNWRDKVGLWRAIDGATDNSPEVKIELEDHGYTTGDEVQLKDNNGDNITSYYTIDRVDDDFFTLRGSVFATIGSIDTGTIRHAGYDIAPEVGFKEDRGNMEHFFIESAKNHISIRPYDEDNRDTDFHGDHGYREGLLAEAKIYVDGEPTIARATAKDIVMPKNELYFDKRVQGHRLNTELSFNKSELQVLGRYQHYVSKDKLSEYVDLPMTETSYQESISSPVMWLTRGETPLLDRSTGLILSGSIDLLTGPDGKIQSGFLTNENIAISNIEYANGGILLWQKGGVHFTSDPGLLTYGTHDGWTLSYFNGTVPASLVLANGSSIFDLRLFQASDPVGDILTDDVLEYYFNDIKYHSGNNFMPSF